MATHHDRFGLLRHPCLCGQYAGSVYAYVANGLDHVESVYGDISWRPGLSGIDNTGPVFSRQKVLCECVEST